jgi:hypothetical protein
MSNVKRDPEVGLLMSKRGLLMSKRELSKLYLANDSAGACAAACDKRDPILRQKRPTIEAKDTCSESMEARAPSLAARIADCAASIGLTVSVLTCTVLPVLTSGISDLPMPAAV